MKKIIKKFSKIFDKYSFGILFGVLSGTGLLVVSYLLSNWIRAIFSLTEFSFIILFLVLFILMLISTTMEYARGIFRIFYLISSITYFALTIFKLLSELA